jgi:hypothetical protein
MNLREHFENGLSPEEYAALLDDNQRRLHALHERRVEIPEQAVDTIRLCGTRRVLVITEPWCGDSLAILPVVLKLFRAVGDVVRIVRRDEHPDLIDHYLTQGGRAIPIVIVLDEEFNERLHWGPRPAPAQAILESHRPDLTAGRIERSAVFKEIRGFYALDRGTSIVAELVALCSR